MTNRHIKTINGRKYYYESIRVGRKVTSRYLGPVEARKRKSKVETDQTIPQEQTTTPQLDSAEENYIG